MTQQAMTTMQLPLPTDRYEIGEPLRVLSDGGIRSWKGTRKSDELECVMKLEPLDNHVEDALFLEAIPTNGFQQITIRKFLAGKALLDHWNSDRTPLSEDAVKTLLKAILRAISTLHEQKTVHGNIKPSNLIITEQGITCIDRLSYTEGLPMERGVSTMAVDLSTDPTWASPELIKGQKLSPSADIYSIGTIFYELLTGRPPFVAETTTQLIAAHLQDTPAAVWKLRPDITATFNAIIMRMLSKNPTARFANAMELLAVLEEEEDQVGLPMLISPQVRNSQGMLDVPARLRAPLSEGATPSEPSHCGPMEERGSH
jgi:serine/threonine protein kinase